MDTQGTGSTRFGSVDKGGHLMLEMTHRCIMSELQKNHHTCICLGRYEKGSKMDHERFYGVLERTSAEDPVAQAQESLRTLGYAVVDGGFSDDQLSEIGSAFETARKNFHETFGGQDALVEIDEHNSIRAAFTYAPVLLTVATNPTVREIVRTLIGGYQVLSQQNGVINPANAQEYNQGAWHRDLPYQHCVFSRPLAINALFCVDDFTHENGATLVLPGTHKVEAFPSPSFVEAAALQVTAPRGSYILLDCMVYHTGSTNRTTVPRRALNHVYTSPILRQQISLPDMLGDDWTDDPDLRKLLGYGVETPRSVDAFIKDRRSRLGR